MHTTIMGADLAAWQARARRWATDFPDLYSLAREHALSIIRRHTGREIDPETIWWHRFDNAVSSPRTFTGWQHSGRPLQSMTFLQLLTQRFAARDQDSLDNLQVEGGFYTDDAEHARYDEHNEVPLLAAQVAADFWTLDFASLYRTRLKDFWRDHSDHFVALARITLLAEIARARHREQLSLNDLHGLRALLEGTSGAHAHAFRLGQYKARDVLRIALDGGGEILYLPGDSLALRRFANPQALYQWLRESLGDERRRAELVRHFISFNESSEPSLDGLNSLFDSIREDRAGRHRSLLDHASSAIAGDPFLWLRDSAKAEMIRQAERLLVSNGHLRERLWIGYLGAFISLGSAFAPLGWPVALGVIGAGVASFVLNVKKAVQASTTQERREGIIGAISSAVVIVFNAPLLYEADALGEGLGGEGNGSPATGAGADAIELTRLLEPSVPTAPIPAAGSSLNRLGLIERTDIHVLYWVDELPRGTAPSALLQQLRPIRRFTHARRLMDGDSLRTFATAAGAVRYAKSAFDGPFALFEIDAEGLATVSVRENLSLNSVAMARAQGAPSDVLEQYLAQGRSLDEFGNGAWGYDEVHLAMAELDASRFFSLSREVVERLSGALPALEAVRGLEGILQGVRTTPIDFGRYCPGHSIEVSGYPQPVRYDPLSDTWRNRAGRAYRFDASSGQFLRVFDPAAEPMPAPAAIEHALRQLGIDLRWPWQVEALSREGAMPLPRALHSVWIGKHMPRAFIKRVMANAEQAGGGERPFSSHLYLSIDDPAERRLTLKRLADRPVSLQVHRLEEAAFFKAFQQTRYYRQYLAARSGPGLNYPSAVDVLRYRLLHSEGGFYLDVDDSIVPPELGQPSFAEHDFVVRPGHLLLNNLVFHRRLNMLMDFNTSNFGSLPGNPLLERISEESYQRFLADPGLYQQRPFDFTHSDSVMDVYGRKISHTTGPGVFNDVIDRELPMFRQYRNLHRLVRGDVYLQEPRLERLTDALREHMEEYSVLGGLIQIGSTASWLNT
jgi:hypothetical protein